MLATAASPKPRGWALLLGWRRLRSALFAAIVPGLMLSAMWGPRTGFFRAGTLALCAVLAFGLFEQWPRRLPRWCARWVLQVLAVATVMPLGSYVLYVTSTDTGAPPFWTDPDRLTGFATLCVLGVLWAPWAALGALVRQKDALARHQALAFDLERSELERQALDARLHLLQAQIAPHFLFNTLANVQALVDTGSPQASAVLNSLIAYLRAAVPRLDDQVTTLGQELELVSAYLELMQMRMPDRLQFALHVDASARALSCPPMTLLTLVENAVRHGIDPSEEGGRIDIHVQRHRDRCSVRVSDTGVGLRESTDGLGTGLATLRERLRLVFGDEARLRVSARQPCGVCAEMDLPAHGAKL